LEKVYSTNGVIDFHGLFLVPAAGGLGAALVLLLFFHPPARADKAEGKVLAG
jgi:hypothetical protein